MSDRKRLTDLELNSNLRRRAGSERSASDLEVRSFVAAVDAKIDAGAPFEQRSRMPALARRSSLGQLAGLGAAAVIVVALLAGLPGLTTGPSPSIPVTADATVTPGGPTPEVASSPALVGTASPSLPPDAAAIDLRSLSCDGMLQPFGGPFYRLDDAVGVVIECKPVESSQRPQSLTAIDRPDGDLEIVWPGSDCGGFVVVRLTQQLGRPQVSVDRRGATPCEFEGSTWTAIALELREPMAAEDVQVATDPGAGAAWWELAPDVRPASSMSRLHLVVYERACANGASPAGRVLPPDVEYGATAVTLTFQVEPLVGGGDCPTAPGTRVDIQLSQPIGDRRLIDGDELAGHVVIDRTKGFLALATHRVDEYALERFMSLVGTRACTSERVLETPMPTQAELETWAAELGTSSGLTEGGFYLGDWIEAARAFGAVEAYVGRPKPWYLVVPGDRLPALGAAPDSLVLTGLHPFPISGGRTLWYAGLWRAVIADRQCVPTTPAPAPASIVCLYETDPGRSAEISIVDHSGLVIGCDASIESSTPDEFVSVANAKTETVLDVRWEIPAVCTSMPVRLELWGPRTYEPVFARPLPFVLQIDGEQPTEGAQGCRPAVATQGVRLVLRSPITAEDVAAFRTSGGRGIGADRLNDHSLTLTLASDKLEYESGEPIDIHASILYSGPRDELTLSGLATNPGFGFHQLDGDVRQTGGGDWICRDLELRREAPATVPFRKQGAFIPSDFPDTAAEEAYWSDPELRLPPGLYRFFVRAGGNLDASCMDPEGESVSAEASIVIRVR